jgi:hypothetical protein
VAKVKRDRNSRVTSGRLRYVTETRGWRGVRLFLKLEGYVTFTSSLCLGAGIAQMLYDYGGWCAVRAVHCAYGVLCISRLRIDY